MGSRGKLQSFCLCSGFPARFVEAIFLSSCSLIDDSIDLAAPFSLVLGVSPRFAESAAPAAFCCAADFAGMANLLVDCLLVDLPGEHIAAREVPSPGFPDAVVVKSITSMDNISRQR